MDFPRVVVLNWNGLEDSLECLESLSKSVYPNFEVLVVDNGCTGKHADRIDANHLYLRLEKNYGLNAGRNISIAFSRSNIIAFLDDDCILGAEYFRNSIDFVERTGCFGFRERIRTRTSSRYNHFQLHYDMEVGGWEESPEFAGGHEGILLSFRMVDRYGRGGCIIAPGRRSIMISPIPS